MQKIDSLKPGTKLKMIAQEMVKAAENIVASNTFIAETSPSKILVAIREKQDQYQLNDAQQKLLVIYFRVEFKAWVQRDYLMTRYQIMLKALFKREGLWSDKVPFRENWR